MPNLKNCVYCGKAILDTSKEHIIQNALGGLYESENICCSDCNNIVSKHIDAPFTKIFNPIIGQIDRFTKTNNEKSTSSYTGKAMYEGAVYDVIIKGGKITSCPSLSKKLRCDATKLDLKIVSYDFKIENKPFKSGFAKIAFNYAIDSGVDLSVLSHGLSIDKNDEKIADISFSYPVIPFVALNPMDNYLELKTEMLLYHNLILFSQGSKLWCYIDLFNTFQYYVLLSEKWNEKKPISNTYLLLLQKLDRTVPEIHLRRAKHALIYADYYGVYPSTDNAVLQKRVSAAIKKKSQTQSMSDVLSSKLGNNYIADYLSKDLSRNEFERYWSSLLLYYDEEDRLIEENFRRVTITDAPSDVVSYPQYLTIALIQGDVDAKEYIYAKFHRLNDYLINQKK